MIRQLQLRGSAEVTQILAQVWPLVLPGALRTLGAFCFLWESGKKAELLRNPASAGLFVVSRAAVRSMAGSVDEVEEAPEGWAEMVDALSGDAVSPDSAVLRGADPGNEAEVAAVADWTAKFLSTTVSAIRAACVVRKGRPAVRAAAHTLRLAARLPRELTLSHTRNPCCCCGAACVPDPRVHGRHSHVPRARAASHQPHPAAHGADQRVPAAAHRVPGRAGARHPDAADPAGDRGAALASAVRALRWQSEPCSKGSLLTQLNP